jgi:threonine/homoserine/homoserine lactone efflux protein
VFLLALVALAAQLQRVSSSGRITRLLNALGGVLFIALAWRIVKERPVL